MVTGVMRIQIIANGRQAQAQMAQLQAQMNGFNRATTAGAIAGQRFQNVFRSGYFEKWAKNLQWTGRQIEYNFTLPLGIAAAAAGKWAMDVERANVRLQKVYGDTSMSSAQVEDDTEKLARAFEVLSDRYGVAQSDVANIGATWAQAGAEGIAVARGTKNSLDLMILGEMEAEEATKALIAIQSQYALSSAELGDAIATLNMIENNTAVGLQDLVSVIQLAGGSAREAGVDIQHLAAMTASLVPATGTARRAGNALRTIIDRTMVPRTQARAFWNEIGIQINEAEWNSLNFTERIERMAAAIADLPKAQQAAIASATAGGFQVARYVTLIADIQDATDGATEARSRYLQAIEASNDAEANTIALQEELSRYLESNPQAFKILWTQLQNLLIRGITPLIPAILGLFSRIVGLVRAFGELSPRTQQFILGGLALIAVLGPLTRITGAFGLLLARFGHLFLFFGRWAGKAGAILLGFGGTLTSLVTALFSWPGLLVAALAATAFALRDHLGGVIEWLSGLFYLLPESAQNALRAVVDVFVGAARAIVDLFRFMLNPFAGSGGSSGARAAAVTSAAGATGRTAEQPATRMAAGGRVGGTGSGDKVPALLEPQEFVIDKHGKRLNEAVGYFQERGVEVTVARMRTGGIVGDVQRFQAGGPVPQRGGGGAVTGGLDPGGGLNLVTAGISPQDIASMREYADATAEASAENDTLVSKTDEVSAAAERQKRSLDALQASLKAAQRVLKGIQDELSAANEGLQQWSSTPITGMRAMGDAIFENEMAQKRLRLEMLRLEEANGSIDKMRDRLSALGSDIESLYAERDDLARSGAGSDVLGVIDARIAAMEEEYNAIENGSSAAGSAAAEYERLSDELENLQRQGQILDLENSLKFDPLTRQIDQAANAMQEMPFDTILSNVQHYRSEVDRLTPILAAQEEVVAGLQDQYDLLNESVGSLSEDPLANFNAAGLAEDWDDVSGSLADLEGEIGSIDDFIAEMLKDVETEFGNFDLFRPIREQWASFKAWAESNISGALGTIIGGGLGASIGSALGGALGGGIQALALSKIGMMFGGMAGPLGMILGAALGAAIGWAAGNLDWGALWENIQNFFGSVGEVGADVADWLQPVLDFFGFLGEAWGRFSENIVDEFSEWGSFFAEGFAALQQVGEWISEFFAWVKDTINTEGTLLHTLWSNFWNFLALTVGPIIEGIGLFISGFFETIRGLFGAIFALINGDFDKFKEYVKTFWSGIGDMIYGLLGATLGAIGGAVWSALQGVYNVFVWLWNALVGHSIVPDIVNGILEWFGSLPGKIIQFFIDLVTGSIEWFTNLIVQGAAKLAEFRARIDLWASALRAMWDAFWLWIFTKVAEKIEQVRAAVSEKVEQVKTIISTFTAAVRTTWNTFWDNIWAKVRDIIDTIKTKVTDFLGEGGTLRTLIAGAVEAVGTLWNGIKRKFASPINFVIESVYNNGIRRVWNWVARKVGLDELERMDTVQGYKEGGDVQGVGAMDRVRALLVPGEFVVRKDGSNLGDALSYYASNPDTANRVVSQISGISKGAEEAARYARGGVVTGDTKGLDPRFYERLKNWSAAVGRAYHVGSGYRSIAEQQVLYNRYRAGVPGQAPAAPPGSSNHNYGLASDGPHWRNLNPGRFGLRFPMSYEPWHVEPNEARQWRGSSGGGGGGGLIEAGVESIINGIISPLRSAVARFSDTGPVPAMVGNLSTTMIDRGVQWARERMVGGMGDDGPRRPAPPQGEPSRRDNVRMGRTLAMELRGWGGGQWAALYNLWDEASDWQHKATGRGREGTGYGIALASPASRMNSIARDWRDNPMTQIKWGLNYIFDYYGNPVEALQAWRGNSPNWYDTGGLLPKGISVSANSTGSPEVVAAQGMIRNEVESVVHDQPAPVEHKEVNNNNYFSGDFVFPNVKGGDDAEEFVENLRQLVGKGSDDR